ncbi:alpha/beta fold hydrolase [Actinomadura graeca]|uniref:Alpha/beta fold hydrolase n=1 Tax=Actinomadura graeca TaxID=2750812 RepID=A0ABX8QQT9_9ACTN|nr:alpha/beta fold hydrolase [Actinomadura graeca]QXJ21145.1 alpha/beta fold hydrolase [Actinomadura graeca]
MREYFAQTKDVRLYVREDGDPGAPPLVLSNSLGTDITMWDPQLDAFAEGHRVIRYDMRGHGRSEASAGGYDIELLARDALAVFDAAGVATADYCGLSLGGMVGQWLAINEPGRLGRAVVANAGIFIPPQAIAPRLEAIRDLGLDGLVEQIVPRWFTPAFITRHPDVIEDLKRVFRANSEDGYYGCSAALGTLDHRRQIGTVSVPILVIGGEHDPATRPEHSEELAERVHGAELLMLDAAHLSNIEQPERFTAAVLGFLARGE